MITACHQTILFCYNKELRYIQSMPLNGVYEWTEKSDSLTLTIPLKGVAPSVVDIVATAATLKINYSPYIIDLVLNGQIDHNHHKAKVKNGTLIVSVKKITQGKWGELVRSNLSQQEKKVVKDESLLQYEADQQSQAEKRKDRKVIDERFALRKQMAVDEHERNRLDNLKAEEKKQAEDEVYKTFDDLEIAQKKSKSVCKTKVSAGVDKRATADFASTGHIASSNSIFDEDDLDDGDVVDEILEVDSRAENAEAQEDDERDVNGVDGVADPVYIPPPRSVNSKDKNVVPIAFTPRIFPTPMRESTLAQEEDWIAKNRKHLKKHGVFGPNHAHHLKTGKKSDISEEDPVWLKAKGDEYYRHGDYFSAINAYSTALDMDEGMIACYSNRSICYLSCNMFADCVEDCDDAMSLILHGTLYDPSASESGAVVSIESVADNTKLVKLCMRKANAKCHMGAFQESLESYDRALNYQNAVCAYHNADTTAVDDTAKTNAAMVAKSIQGDVEKLQLINKAENIKLSADKCISEGAVENAMKLYTEALELIPVYASCLSNRSACKLASGDIKGCIEDCSVAIKLLKTTASSGGTIMLGSTQQQQQLSSMLAAILPPEKTEKRKQWLLKTVVRRGAAYFQSQLIDEAIQDYGFACSLDEKNESLKKDLTKMINTRAAMEVAPELVGSDVVHKPS